MLPPNHEPTKPPTSPKSAPGGGRPTRPGVPGWFTRSPIATIASSPRSPMASPVMGLKAPPFNAWEVGIGGLRSPGSMEKLLVPLIGGIGTKKNPPIGRKYTTYIPLIVLAYWVLREPETAIDWGGFGWDAFFFQPKIHPRKLIWNLKRMVSKRNLLFQGSIFRFHVFGGVTRFGEQK